MIINYLKIAWRQTIKNPAFSFINIFGLALSMAVCLFVILVIKDTYSYDGFHADSDRVYRINTEAFRKSGDKERYASSPYPVAAALQSQNPNIEAFTVCNSAQGLEFDYNNLKIRGRTYFSNKSFFDVFGFTLKEGTKESAIEAPNTVILSHELAVKLFPLHDAINKTIQLGFLGQFTITGILNELPGKTHLDFDAIASLASIPVLEKNGLVSNTLNNWNDYYQNFSYVKLKPGVDPMTIENALTQIAETNYKGKVLESRDAGYRFYLQPLNKITPGPILSNSEGKGLSKMILWVLSTLASIIMLSSVFNYTSLTVARIANRLKEIAMRRVAGSKSSSIVSQIVIESILTSALALVIAFFILLFLIPKMEATSFINESDINLNLKATSIVPFVLFSAIIGIIGGLLPGLTLSRIKPIELFRNLQNTKLFKHVGTRNVLLCFQLIICLLFVNLIYIMNKQMKYSTLVNFGNQHAQVFNIDLQGQSYQLALQKFKQIPGIENISGISHLMGNYSDWSDDVRINKDQEKIGVREYFIDDQYLKNFTIDIVAGQNFEPIIDQKNDRTVIVNEYFVNKFKLGSPTEAIGKGVIIGDSTLLSIGAVVKDFLYKPSEYALDAVMLRYVPSNINILNVNIKSTDINTVLSKIEQSWKALDPIHPMEGGFYHAELDRAFRFVNDSMLFVTFIAFLGIVITCLGLLGMAIYTVQNRRKEISIRKVIGANVLNVVTLLSKSYVKIILVAIFISAPLIYLLAQKMLNQYAQKIMMSPLLLIPGILTVLIVTGFTVCSQTIKAAFMNPIKNLNRE